MRGNMGQIFVHIRPCEPRQRGIKLSALPDHFSCFLDVLSLTIKNKEALLL
jgi:hypothetical protein